jgi:hypothetical protein
MREMWEELMQMLMIDMLHTQMTANDGYMLDEIDEQFKGKAVNGSGVCIDFDEIRKAEEYNDLADMSRRLSAERKEKDVEKEES